MKENIKIKFTYFIQEMLLYGCSLIYIIAWIDGYILIVTRYPYFIIHFYSFFMQIDDDYSSILQWI